MIASSQKADVHSFFDIETSTFSYVVVDGQTGECAIIDSVTEFDYVSGRTSTLSADKIISFVRDNNYHVSWLLETHIHADHLSAAPYIKKYTGGMIGIGRHIVEVQRYFYHIFNTEDDFEFDGHDFDRLFHHNECLNVGRLSAKVFHTPGHTPGLCVLFDRRHPVCRRYDLYARYWYGKMRFSGWGRPYFVSFHQGTAQSAR